MCIRDSNVSVSALTSSSVTLTWTSANTEHVPASYIIQYRRKYSPDKYTDITNVSSTQYMVSSLSADTEYEFRIIAVNSVGLSQPSSPVNVTTDAAPKERSTRIKLL